MMKKFVSLLLTVVLLAAMFTVFALPTSAEGEVSKSENATWLVDEGDDHVWYELTENDTVVQDGKTGRTLTISGKGEMPDYIATTPTLDDRPWKDYIETITTVMIESGVTSIGDNAFNGCTNLTSVTIPSSVTRICQSAFRGCASLQSVTIPSSVTSIGKSTFQACASLQSVTIPSSVTSIKSEAFANCTGLQSVTIPYGVVSIGSSTFQNCTSLQSVTIPSSVTRIEGSAFNSCRQLASVTVKTSIPPTLGKKAFDRTADDLAIYVPCGAGTAYQETTNWSDKSGQIKEAYVVDDQPGKNGTIMLDKDCFPKETYTEPNETVTVTVMPADGYRLKADSLLVTYKDENGEEMTADLTQDETDPMKYTFTMPCSNVTVTAEFEKIADESEPAPTATVFSEGNIWIIIAAAVVVIGLGGAAALFIVKKKKKPAASDE